MNIEDLSLWDFTAKLSEGDGIVCPECNRTFNHQEWKEVEVHCDICGEHAAMQCPYCEVCFDHVWSPPFVVVSPDGKVKKKEI